MKMVDLSFTWSLIFSMKVFTFLFGICTIYLLLWENSPCVIFSFYKEGFIYFYDFTWPFYCFLLAECFLINSEYTLCIKLFQSTTDVWNKFKCFSQNRIEVSSSHQQYINRNAVRNDIFQPLNQFSHTFLLFAAAYITSPDSFFFSNIKFHIMTIFRHYFIW